MIRFTASLSNESPSGSVTTTATIEFNPGAPDAAARIRALVDQVTAAAQPKVAPANGHAQPNRQPAPVAPHNGGNGNGHNGGNGNGDATISPKQKGFILGLGAKLGLKIADVNGRAKQLFGPDATLHNLTKNEASALIDALRAEAPAARGE